MFILRSIKSLITFFRILVRRIRAQGIGTTMNWLYTIGMAKLTGRVSLRYSRLTPNLYIGPQFGRRGKSALEKAGINASVNMRAEFNDMDHGLDFKDYSYLPTEDNTPPSMLHLEEGVAFIQRMIDKDGKVYVHCGSGVGRAPSIAAAYLVSTGMPLEEAVERIQIVRPFVRILPGQMERLKEFEARVRGAPATEGAGEVADVI
jgi:protein-tyrosine phosphatase